MSPVELKKGPCRPVDLKGQGPHSRLSVVAQIEMHYHDDKVYICIYCHLPTGPQGRGPSEGCFFH